MRFPTVLSRTESKVLSGIEEYFTVVKGTAESFSKLVAAIGSGKTADSKVFFREVLDGEDRADSIHRDLSLTIAEGAFFGGVREDILNLLEKMDDIADAAKDAARFLEAEESLDEFALSILSSEPMRNFVSSLVATVASLGELIAAFRLGKKEILAKIAPVEKKEETADDFKDQLMKELFRSTEGRNPITVIQLRDFIFVADDIADSAEDASDVILILAAKGYE